MAAVRYTWMFRTAAVIYLTLGASAMWRYGLTDYDHPHRLWGLGCGALALVVGLFLLRRARLAIGLSAIGAALVALAAALAAPLMHGPVILALALLAIGAGLYAAFAGRVLLEAPK